MKNSLMYGLILLLTVVTASLTLVSCEKSSTTPMPPPVYDLEIYIYRGAPEIIIGSSIRLGGTLKNAQGDSLSGYQVRFEVIPDSLGVITPVDYAYTLPSDSAGFRERVMFTARKAGFGYFQAAYYSGGVLRDLDTLHIQVRPLGNF